MTQNRNNRTKVYEIIIKRFNPQKPKGASLINSLYALQPDADKKVIEILKDSIVNLNEILSVEDISILKDNYPLIWRKKRNIDKIYNDKENKRYTIPIEIKQLCYSLAKCKPNSRIYLPFAGSVLFIDNNLQDCSYTGFEENPQLWASTQIRLYYGGINANISLGKEEIKNQKFDYIFCFPPIKNRGNNQEVIDNITDLVHNNLAENGEIYCILPSNFCYESEWLDLRKIPFESDNEYSTLLITLPTTSIISDKLSLCLFRLKKERLDDNESNIVLVNANDKAFISCNDIYIYDPESLSLKVKSILDTIELDDIRFVWKGSIKNQKLSENLNFLPKHYLPIMLDDPLNEGELVQNIDFYIEEVNLKNIDKPTDKIPLIGMKDLSSNYLNCDLTYNQIQESEYSTTKVLTTDCMLVGYIAGKVKVARIHGLSEENPVALSPEVLAFKYHEDYSGIMSDHLHGIEEYTIQIKDNITYDYLLRCLTGKYIEKQANAKAFGSTVKRLKKEDFLTFDIIVPTSLKKQEDICKEDMRRSVLEADQQIAETYKEFRKDMHMKKHAIGQTLFNLNNWLKLLNTARSKGNGIVDDSATIGKTRKIQVSDIYDNLEIVMSKLNLQLSKFDTGYGLSVEDFSLTEFIEKYISEHGSPLFEYIFDSKKYRADEDLPDYKIKEESLIGRQTGESLLKKGDALDYVKFAPEALTMVFNNIISNACAHGFTDRENETNKILIEILSEGTDLIIYVSNNGKPLNVSSNDIFTYGLTSGNAKEHFGIGGYEIKNLMKEFDGDVFVKSDPESEYTITYKLVFHDTNILASF